jgi:hypothetical protein
MDDSSDLQFIMNANAQLGGGGDSPPHDDMDSPPISPPYSPQYSPPPHMMGGPGGPGGPPPHMMGGRPPPHMMGGPPPGMSPENMEQIAIRKAQVIQEGMDIMRKGGQINCPLEMQVPLPILEAAVNQAKEVRRKQTSVELAKKIMVTSVSFLELANAQVDPFGFDLTGWSSDVSEKVDRNEFDEIMEELYEKYKGRGNVAPEVKLLFMLLFSGASVHLSKTVLKSRVASARDIAREAPEIFGNRQQQQQQQPQQQQPRQGVMSGPSSNIDDIIAGVMAQNPPRAPHDMASTAFFDSAATMTQPPQQQQQQKPQQHSLSSSSDSSDDDSSSDDDTDAFIAVARGRGRGRGH